MKKISHLSTISSVIVLAFIVPQIAFAAWWNPISWFGGWNFFHKTETQTQVLENGAKELESKLNNSTTTNAVDAATTPATTTPAAKKEIKKTEPAVGNSAIIQAQVQAKVEAALKAKADEQAKIDAAKIEADKQAQIETKKAQQAIDDTKQDAQYAQAKIDLKNQQKQEINTKIAEMNQLNVQIDTYRTTNTDQGFVDILNNAIKLDGSKIFPKRYKISGIPTSTELHAFVANYRAALYVDLQKYL